MKRELNMMLQLEYHSIPEDIDEVVSSLNNIGGLIIASDWYRSDIVNAWVQSQSGKRTDLVKNFTRLTMTEFSDLGINGLSSRNAIRHYLNAWQLSGKPKPKPFLLRKGRNMEKPT